VEDNTAGQASLAAEIAVLNKGLAEVTNHTLAECEIPLIDDGSSKPAGTVVADTRAVYTCDVGFYMETQGEDGTSYVRCPLGGGDVEGTPPACQPCFKGCAACSKKYVCTKCEDDDNVPANGGSKCVKDLGTENTPAESCTVSFPL
jgi:hypothetical protein